MAKCRLRIEILDDRDFVRPGEDLEVIVYVDCDSTVKCNGLTLACYWKTHGRGNVDTGKKHRVELFVGEWEPGNYEYSTTISFPSEPASYHGEVINIDWYLKAEADVPFAFDPSAEEMVLVVDPSTPRPYVEPEVWAPQPVAMSSKLGGCFAPAIFGLIGAVVLGVQGHMVWAVLVAAFCLYFLRGSRQADATIKAVGHVAMEVYPAEVAPGESVHVLLEVQPEADLKVEHITLTMKSREVATSGSGTNQTTYSEVAFELKETLATNLQLDGTQRFEREVSFDLPVTAPPSFKASDNETMTTLTLSIQPVDQPALTHSRQVKVVNQSRPS